MGAVFDILHPSFKNVLRRADEYLPADECLESEGGGRQHKSGTENWNSRELQQGH